MSLTAVSLKTKIYKPEMDLVDFILESVPKEIVKEKMVLAITSKIVSLAEHRLVKKSEIDKVTLVKQEADVFLNEIAENIFLTIKDGLFIASAGIDESNSQDGDYILYPKDSFLSAKNLWLALREKWGLNELGIILTDSHVTPLRRGVTGVCLSYYGFKAVRSLVGEKDLFGKPLKFTSQNFADGLSATAVMLMGEAAESRPLAIIQGAEIDFCANTNPEELKMPLDEDLFYPFFKKS